MQSFVKDAAYSAFKGHLPTHHVLHKPTLVFSIPASLFKGKQIEDPSFTTARFHTSPLTSTLILNVKSVCNSGAPQLVQVWCTHATCSIVAQWHCGCQ
mmetsp:Transcript_152542/g.265860  ORF Transcript_152542/g.265860 Transcript_152542/m.265860 type:complete len:98 (-) Transcript_152542:363-656(-)